MPSSPKSRTISLRTSLTEKMKVKHQIDLKIKPSQTKNDFGGYVNDLLEYVLEKDEFLRIYAPSISLIDIHDNILFLRDHGIKNKTVEVFLKDKELWCDQDKSHNCKHVKYAFAIPEVAKLNLKSPK